MKKQIHLLAIVVFLLPSLAFAQYAKQRNSGKKEIQWGAVKKETPAEGMEKSFLYFEGAVYDGTANNLPVYVYKGAAENNASHIKAFIVNPVYAAFETNELAKIEGLDKIDSEIEVSASVAYEKKKKISVVSFIPVRKNPSSGQFEKLLSFDLQIVATDFKSAQPKSSSVYASNSVLGSGNWYKIAVNTDGIYKLSYEQLQEMGMNVSSVNPKNLRVYGNGGGMLPKANADFRHDDLQENAVVVVGENDNSFDAGDYILFYGQSPHRWKYNSTSAKFEHTVNDYSDNTYYFITADLGAGKRVTTLASTDQPATYSTNTFNDYAFHELDEKNIIKSGRQWYGEYFDINTAYDFSFSFPNISGSTPATIKVSGAGACACGTGSSTSFNVKVNNGTSLNIPFQNITGVYTNAQASDGTGTMDFTANSSTLNVNVTYNKGGYSTAVAWLNYIELNVRRLLSMTGGQLIFRDANSVGPGNVAEFSMSNFSASVTIWDVTDPVNVRQQMTSTLGSTGYFRASADTLHEYVAFDGSSYLIPTSEGAVANQDLHALPQVDMVIVVHPDFLSEAERLANFHRNNVISPLTVAIVTPQQVYNEFSSGAQDVSAIRDMMKMLYDRATNDDEMPKYLLLFGDGSYDNRDRLDNNTNYIVTYQSAQSLSPTSSYVSDNFFGFLDSNEGVWVEGCDSCNPHFLDIGIGRFPVQTIQEATTVVNKILNYEGIATVETNPSLCTAQTVSISSPDWKNWICFVGDDEDNNQHFDQADAIAKGIDTTQNNYNLDKIYFDAFIEESTPGGQRYPSVKDAINNRVLKGALVINYTGHGGEVGWAHERVLEVADINGWTNIENLPAFVTATCEFSRFEDPARTSAGELVLLNPNGGGIALFTTTRLVFSAPNFTLNKNFYKHFFPVDGEPIPTMGEVMRKTVNEGTNGVIQNSRNFSLLGDPAQRLAYPVNNVVTTSVNGNPVGGTADTLKALGLVTVAGEIRDRQGNKMTGFNGLIYPTVFDKAATINTLANDPGSHVDNFKLQKNILYKGKASVTNGDFSFTFIVPKDISYSFGPGRISYYAYDGFTDATGYYENVVIGGSADSVAADAQGPQVNLYLNDDKFVFGGTTNENPLLYAVVSDPSGINTVGNGIGHDIAAILDENTNKTIVLNEYYQADLNSYQSGTIRYPFSELSEGRHTLKMKVWDVYNNSSDAYTEFVVSQSAELALSHVLNYPNPFTTNTQFMFEHNRPCADLDVNIQIFTVSGKVVKTINEQVNCDGFRAEGITWNGRDEYDQKIGKGVYVYKIKVRTPEGYTAQAFEKLVILN
ncbi:MAG: hypothetical protein POELPBGB_03151 [Bacteroidia bacterium]|nr:hypothetical protein [Bacteroidia bacterium]